jgi:NMD protein affecting ribosome stability and mRNA decay
MNETALESRAETRDTQWPVATDTRAALRARCGSCNVTFTEQRWLALTLAVTLTPSAIGRHVVRWPAGDAIEIRRCSGCGRTIARRARWSPSAA